MMASLLDEIAKHGDQAAVLPIKRLDDIRQDVADMQGRGDLNNFQRYILNDLYHLDVPDTGFVVRSIIIVATPSPSAARLFFTWKGKRFLALLPASYVDKSRAPVKVEQYLTAFLHPGVHHICYAPQLPHKLIAVRSGLGRYGRNNICYVEGMGSFLNLSPYFSDIECIEHTWQDLRQMDLCLTCQACLQNCPTAAIRRERFLIDNERCLTYFNEAGAEWNFPEWIDPSSHHTLYGCLRCQTICPVDKPYLNSVMDPVEFTEEETDSLMERKPFDLFPESLQQKVEALDMTGYLGALPRNIRALFDNFAKSQA